MLNYEGTCKGVCSYNLVYNFLIQLLPLRSSVFVVHFSNAFWHGNKTKKLPLKIKLFLFLQSFISYIANIITVWKYVSTGVIIKTKIFHLCHTCAVLVAFVSHLLNTRVTHVSIVSLSCCSCCTRPACVLCFKIDQILITL